MHASAAAVDVADAADAQGAGERGASADAATAGTEDVGGGADQAPVDETVPMSVGDLEQAPVTQVTQVTQCTRVQSSHVS